MEAVKEMILVRIWFLFHFALAATVVFILAAMARVPDGRGYPLGLSAKLFWILATLAFVYSVAHIIGFWGILRRTKWSWKLALAIILFDIVAKAATALELKSADSSTYFSAIVLLFELVVLCLPGVREEFEPKVAFS